MGPEKLDSCSSSFLNDKIDKSDMGQDPSEKYAIVANKEESVDSVSVLR
jgi:hypothetical protein